MLTPRQIMNARRLLSWSRETLATMSNVPISVVLTYERIGRADAVQATAMRAALEATGAEFEGGDSPGVRLRSMQP